MLRGFVSALTLLVASLHAGPPTEAQSGGWRLVSRSRQSNISGMALVENSARGASFLVVNDNKLKQENHAAIVSVEGDGAPQYTPLRWLGEDVPTDLEAVTFVPDTKDNYMAFTSAGRVYHVEISRTDNSVRVLKSFDVPRIPASRDFEGFALQKVKGRLLAVWADRGLDSKPAQLFWAEFDLWDHSFARVGSAFLRVPYPVGNTRHVSDVKVDPEGIVYISSASDPGDDGPFASAVYVVGSFGRDNSKGFVFTPRPVMKRLHTFDGHKVEALELLSGAKGAMAFGTDDENLGAAIYLSR